MKHEIYIVSWIESGNRLFIKYYSKRLAEKIYDELKKEKQRCRIRELHISKVIK